MKVNVWFSPLFTFTAPAGDIFPPGPGCRGDGECPRRWRRGWCRFEGDGDGVICGHLAEGVGRPCRGSPPFHQPFRVSIVFPASGVKVNVWFSPLFTFTAPAGDIFPPVPASRGDGECSRRWRRGWCRFEGDSNGVICGHLAEGVGRPCRGYSPSHPPSGYQAAFPASGVKVNCLVLAAFYLHCSRRGYLPSRPGSRGDGECPRRWRRGWCRFEGDCNGVICGHLAEGVGRPCRGYRRSHPPSGYQVSFLHPA